MRVEPDGRKRSTWWSIVSIFIVTISIIITITIVFVCKCYRPQCHRYHHIINIAAMIIPTITDAIIIIINNIIIRSPCDWYPAPITPWWQDMNNESAIERIGPRANIATHYDDEARTRTRTTTHFSKANFSATPIVMHLERPDLIRKVAMTHWHP